MLDGDDGHEAFAHVVAVQFGILVLDEIIGLRVVVNHAGERGTEAGEVRTAFGLVDEVGVAEDHLVVAVVILQGDVEGHAAHAWRGLLAVGHHARVGEVGEVDFGGDEDRLIEEALLIGVEEGDILGDAVLELELVGAVGAMVLHVDRDTRDEEGQFAHAAHDRVVLELLGGDEDFRVRMEGDLRAGTLRLADDLDRLRDFTTAELHLVDFTFAAHFRDKAIRESVDALRADAVEATRDLVGTLVELTAGVQVGEHELERRNLFFRVHRDGNTATIVLDGQRAVRMDLDLDALAITGERFVDRVVDDLIHAVVEARLVRIADIHTGSFAHGLEAFEALDVGRAVAFVAGVLAAVRVFLGIFAHV